MGCYLVYLGLKPNLNSLKKTSVAEQSKTETLKKYLLSIDKPQRIEIINLSQRFENDVNQIKKIKISQDKKSNFYLSIQFFTDESDEKAPLIAQIRFIEIQSGNTIKEDSLSLE